MKKGVSEDEVLAAFQKEQEPLNAKLKDAVTQRLKNEAQLNEELKRGAELSVELQVLRSGNEGMFLYLERERYRRMSLWWYAVVVATLTMTAGSLQRQSYGFASCNFASFLFVWRSLYVQHNTVAMAAAVMAIAFTVWFA